jgi:type IV secretion system protein VirD4
MLTMRPWLLSIALGIALLNAPPAQADVPQQIIDQTADLRVQQTELKHLTAIGKLTGPDAAIKQQAIEAQIKTLWLPYRALPPAEDTRARTAIDRLVTDKLSFLRPQWIQEESAFKAARDQRNKQLSAEAEDDARAAAELQRRRVVLQKQLAAGTLTRDAFDVQDKQPSDGIAAFRKKYDAEGAQWSNMFDQRYRVMLEAALKNPDTPLPQPGVAAPPPVVAAAPPGVATVPPAVTAAPPPVASVAPVETTTPPDFAADVQTAADLEVRREENAYQFDKKQISQALMANTNAVINRDLAALKARYDALVPKRGAAFETAYLQAAAPRIQALKVQYYPEPYRPAAVSPRAAPQKVAPIQQTAPAGSVLDGFVVFGGITGALALGIWWWRGGVAKATKGLSPGIRRTAYAIAALAMLALLSVAFGLAAAVLIATLILAIWWWRGGLAKATKDLSPAIRRTAYVIAALVLLASFAHFFGQTVAAVIGAVVLSLWGLVRWHNATEDRRKRDNNQNAISKFGVTQEERSKNIESAFDKRAGDVEFDLNERGIRCHFLRSISAMSPREREVLRTAYHLYNLGLMYSERNFFLIRFALIYADGKAVITGSTKYPQNNPAIISIATALKWYQESNGLEAMTNLTLTNLQSAINKNQDDPVLRKLSSRLHGDGGDLVPGAPLKSAAKGAAVEAGLILGLDEKAPDTWWYYDGEGSLITVAPPGSGKTQCQVFPNLLMWQGAAVVLDVKGEIYEQTSKWRRENVGPVYKFSPLDPATSHGYNPLAEVRADPDYLWEDARFLSDMMIVPSGAKDPFWEHRARDVLTAAIARVCLEQDVAKRSMGAVLDILHGVGWDKFVTYLEARVDFASMTRAGHSLASMEPKTRDGVLQSALSSMSAWDGERIARATRKSDWSPLDLRAGTNPTIYICLKPNEVDSYISVLRVLIAQHIRSLTSTRVPAHGVQPILFILDELPRLRHMPPVEEALEIGRQYGIKLWLFAQSLGQLKEAYPNADGMIGGCAIRMFMNPSLHDETAQKVSDDIGFQESVVDGTRVKVVEPNVLSGPDYKDVVIVMAANARVARLRKYFAYADDALKERMGTLRLAESVPA